ncbi:uncharacterized protein EKO05_0003214 [Ascochyta rabiei]|uniref:uncharacterized protein n=1 Tax=Didymella rabiei TaxID=5454 RepID=UPI0019002C48|nr:uncharacterized protein EKO05_0003214 [Ascochyta rabiei]UPX12673.1 hypothetical protein EKO05_0003214 [Ascochyta rabiei]
MRAGILSSLICLVSLSTAKANNLIPKSFHRHQQQSGPERRDVTQRLSYLWSGGEVYGSRMASVSAEMIIPNITFPHGYNASATYSSSVWVGIGGDQNMCDNPERVNNGGLIQGGFYYMYDPQGDHGVFAFYEWFPLDPVFLDDTHGILTDIGDHVRMSVSQKNNITGTYTWENFTKNKKFSIDLKAPVNGTLCTNHAEWIVESFLTQSDPFLFPDFGQLTFTKAKAITEKNEVAPLSNGKLITAQPVLHGHNLTKCNFIQPDGVTCKWNGFETRT